MPAIDMVASHVSALIRGVRPPELEMAQVGEGEIASRTDNKITLKQLEKGKPLL
jgi:hypothetical protein